MKKSQTDKIYAYMKENKGISPDKAKELFACNRLASRISDIKKKYGVAISTQIIKTKNKFGEPCRYAFYSIEEDC